MWARIHDWSVSQMISYIQCNASVLFANLLQFVIKLGKLSIWGGETLEYIGVHRIISLDASSENAIFWCCSRNVCSLLVQLMTSFVLWDTTTYDKGHPESASKMQRELHSSAREVQFSPGFQFILDSWFRVSFLYCCCCTNGYCNLQRAKERQTLLAQRIAHPLPKNLKLLKDLATGTLSMRNWVKVVNINQYFYCRTPFFQSSHVVEVSWKAIESHYFFS